MANDDSTRAGFDLSPWRGKDPLTISEAACLWYGLKPGMTKALIKIYPVAWADAMSRAENMAKEAKAGRLPIVGRVRTYQQTIRRAVRSKYLGGGEDQQPAGQENEDWGAAPVALADLRAYAESIGERPAFFFPEAVDILAPRCLEEGPHFSGELAAALLAWQYASNLADGSKKKPRALIVEWLKTNRPQYGEGGKAFERIATLANWEKTTGPKRME